MHDGTRSGTTPSTTLDLLRIAQQLFGIAQNGLHFTADEYDLERYREIRKLAAVIAAGELGALPASIVAAYKCERGPATPKIDVRGALFRGDDLLLVRERADGLWSLPGGWADIGEPPSAAVEREIVEESGYVARVIKVIGIYDRSAHPHPPYPFYVYKLHFLCEIVSEGGRPTAEASAVEFFSEAYIPELSTARVTANQIAAAFAHHRRPELPTYFD